MHKTYKGDVIGNTNEFCVLIYIKFGTLPWPQAGIPKLQKSTHTCDVVFNVLGDRGSSNEVLSEEI
jgi:hypothetical protein